MQGGPDAALKPVTPYISCNGFRGKEYLCQLTGGGPFDVLPPDLEIPVSSANTVPLRCLFHFVTLNEELEKEMIRFCRTRSYAQYLKSLRTNWIDRSCVFSKNS